jgi:hypothetical protein
MTTFFEQMWTWYLEVVSCLLLWFGLQGILVIRVIREPEVQFGAANERKVSLRKHWREIVTNNALEISGCNSEFNQLYNAAYKEKSL